MSEKGLPAQAFGVRELRPTDQPELCQWLIRSWGSTVVVAHGVRYDASELPGLLAVPGDELDGPGATNGTSRGTNAEALGLLTYNAEPHRWEVVTLDAFRQGIGVGTALLDELEQRAAHAGAHEVWLVTTNDNTHALRFYQRRGYDLTRLLCGAVDVARTTKPEIPMTADGIPIRHELELTKSLALRAPS